MSWASSLTVTDATTNATIKPADDSAETRACAANERPLTPDAPPSSGQPPTAATANDGASTADGAAAADGGAGGTGGRTGRIVAPSFNAADGGTGRPLAAGLNHSRHSSSWSSLRSFDGGVGVGPHAMATENYTVIEPAVTIGDFWPAEAKLSWY